MKRVFFIVFGFGIVAIAGVGCSGKSPAPKKESERTEAKTVIGVEELIEGPDRMSQKIRVQGLVGRVLPEQGLFSLVDLSDREELLQTGKTQCVTLPVRWSGPMPALQDELLVEGEIQKSADGLVFVSHKVEKVTNGTQK